MLAILAMSPVMLHAQVKSSAQPGSTPVLQSSNIQPAAFAAVNSPGNDAAAPTPVRISTGVIQPRLIHSVDVDLNHITPGSFGEDRMVAVKMTIDETGKPTNLKVIKSTDMFTDEGVLAAIADYRYEPATLNGIPVPIDLTLHFNIQQ
jgi:TonB family protein